MHLLPISRKGHLCLVASDLLISLQCGSAFKEIHSLEDGIGSKFPAYLQHGSLQTPVSFQCLIVDKHVHLKNAHILCYIICTDTQPPVKSR